MKIEQIVQQAQRYKEDGADIIDKYGKFIWTQVKNLKNVYDVPNATNTDDLIKGIQSWGRLFIKPTGRDYLGNG